MKLIKRRLVYVGFAFPHHKGSHAGYHQVKDYLQYDMEIDCQEYFERSQVPNFDLSLISKLKMKIIMDFFHL